MEELLRQVAELAKLVEQLNEQLRMQREQTEKLIAAKDAENAMLMAQVKALTERIEELTHKKNSGNSSKPPSSERLEKPAPKSLREKSGKPVGGRPGHKGSGMKITRKPDEIIEHLPTQCTNCPYAGKCDFRCCNTRYEYDVVVKTHLIAHEAMKCEHCRISGESLTGSFPEHITGTKQYSAGVAAFAVSLLTIGYVSVDRVRKLLGSLGIPVSSGAIQNMLSRAAEKAAETVEQIRKSLAKQPVVHYDETGLRVAGKLHWLHCACSRDLRYYSVQKKRGADGIEGCAVLPGSSGVAVHDFWSAYNKFDNVEHGMCCQHLERELLYEDERGQSWAGSLRKLLQTMCHRRNELMSQGYKSYPDDELTGYYARYDELVAQGIEKNPIPEHQAGRRGRTAKGKCRCLLERFKNAKADILRFAVNWEVPYTNNIAEQAIRFARVKEKVSGCFRTKSGADNFACILSLISSAALHGIACFDALARVFSGDNFNTVFAED